jgi:hypothetical protein
MDHEHRYRNLHSSCGTGVSIQWLHRGNIWTTRESDGLSVLHNHHPLDSAFRSNEQFGVKRLEDTIRASREKSPAEIITALYKAVLDFSGGTKQCDDLTAVVIKRK